MAHSSHHHSVQKTLQGTNDELHVVVFDEDGGITGTAISGAGNRVTSSA